MVAIKTKTLAVQRRRFILLMLGPAVAMLILFTIYPLITNLSNSFISYNLTEPHSRDFVGFGNFITLFRDRNFWSSLLRTLYFVGGAVGIQFVLGMGVAHLLNHDFRGKNILRTLFILPMGTTPIAISFVWRIMLNPDLGVYNYFIRQLGLRGMDWVGNPSTVIPALVLVDSWCWTPFMMLIFSAGLLALPQEPFEAAAIDGASTFQKLAFITLPLLKPLILVALLFRIIDAFRTFDIIFVITGGGPGRFSETLNIMTYLQGFRFLRISYASTLAIVMVIVLILVGRLVIRFYKSGEETA